MDDFREMARDPRHRRSFEKLLYLAAERGDADLVAERLSWGIDPNCTFRHGRTPLIGNVRSSCPSAETVRALLAAGADPELADEFQRVRQPRPGRPQLEVVLEEAVVVPPAVGRRPVGQEAGPDDARVEPDVHVLAPKPVGLDHPPGVVHP